MFSVYSVSASEIGFSKQTNLRFFCIISKCGPMRIFLRKCLKIVIWCNGLWLSGLGFWGRFCAWKKLKFSSEKFGSKGKNATFALPFEKRVSREGQEFLKRLTLKIKKWKIFEKKIWKLKNKAYLCIPVRKTGPHRGKTTSSLKRLDFILYKKQVPRNTKKSRSVNSFVDRN